VPLVSEAPLVSEEPLPPEDPVVLTLLVDESESESELEQAVNSVKIETESAKAEAKVGARLTSRSKVCMGRSIPHSVTRCDQLRARDVSTGLNRGSQIGAAALFGTMTRIAWLPVACTLACTSQPAPPAPPVSPASAIASKPHPPASSVASTAAPPAPPEPKGPPVGYRKQDLADAVCTKRMDRAPCHAAEWFSGGTDSAGRELVVVKLALFDGPGVGDDIERKQAGACDHYEYWLVPLAGGRAVEPRLLLGVCNDGYGAAGVGEDLVEVSQNTFKHSQEGGSAWRWSETVSVSLSPLRVRALESNSFWTLDAHFRSTRFDWETFRGREAWYTPYCKADGSMDAEPLDSDDVSIGGDLESPPSYAYASELVPVVTLDPKFVEAPGSVALGACALTLDAGKTTGFVLEGTAGEASDASLSIVAHPDGKRVFIEVRDDVLTLRPAQRFDRLELWSSEGKGGREESHCVAPSQAQISAFDIDMTGRVDRKRGQGRAPKVSVVDAGSGVRRFVLSWQKPTERFTLVYADSDDGTATERRFATSMLRPDNPDSFGTRRFIAAKEATCTVQAGRLEPVLTLGYEAKVP